MDPLNLIRLKPFYPGQWGIPGSDNHLGLRSVSRANVYFVDYSNANANDNNDGTDPDAPLATVQAAVNKVDDWDTIVVRSMTAESVVTLDYATGGNYVNLVGASFGTYTPYWESDAAASACLDLRAVGWRIAGFRFGCPVTGGGILLRHTDTGANDIAINTIIEDCHFYGQTTARYGIISYGCYEVTIRRCTFENFHHANGAVAISTGACPLAIPFRNLIEDCHFYENDNHINGEFNASRFLRNIFAGAGIAYTATIKLNTDGGVGAGGARNIVFGNKFGGAYTTAGYVSTGTDEWYGNYTNPAGESVPGVTVHACGLTIAAPAA